jgi:undecaprenyl-diphosphatase
MILNNLFAFDLWFENLLVSIRNPFFVQLFRDITFFGNATTVIGLVVFFGIFLLWTKTRRVYLAGLFVSLAGATGTTYVLKEVVGRLRPSGSIPTSIETDFSFPSGHATASMAFYGFTAYILCRLYPLCAKAILSVATIVVLLIGFSRLYLGLHFPTDVIAGYVVGGVWVWIGIKMAQKLQTPR